MCAMLANGSNSKICGASRCTGYPCSFTERFKGKVMNIDILILQSKMYTKD
jgi:hypothetical protein